MALNFVWLGLFLVAFGVACVRLLQGDVNVFTEILSALFGSAKTSFDIALGLVGMMALWLGFMRVGEKAGAVELFARAVNPVLRHIFPGVPGGHPAQGAMTMNLSANLLGLDNAATPLGLTAMRELQTLNPKPDTATNAQIMFLVLNTAGLTLIPTSVIAIRQTMALEQGLVNFNAADIFLPTLVGTFISLMSGLLAVAWVQRINLLRPALLFGLGGFAALLYGAYAWLRQFPPAEMAQMAGLVGSLFILSIIIAFLALGAWRRVNVYEAFIEGAKDGFTVAIMIVPYLVAMLAAISVFRASGCLDYVIQALARGVALVGLNTDFVPALPVGIMKTFSGAGARGLMVDVMKTYGVDSFQGKLAAIIQGSTETTFYVLAVYFGSVGIKKTRYALACGLVADVAGLIGAILVAYAFFK